MRTSNASRARHARPDRASRLALATTGRRLLARGLIAGLLAGGGLIAAGCVNRPVDKPTDKETQQTPGYFPQSVERDVDLLFVIDNSGSMGEEQVNLVRNFPKLIEALRSPTLGADSSGKPCNESNRSGCRIPNVHIGVVSSDLGSGNFSLPSCEVAGGDKGKLLSQPRVAGCSGPTKPWISYIDGKTNIAGGGGDPIEDVKAAFTCIASLGINGCGFEHQLEAARRALDPKTNLNPGFIRQEAFLAIVFITDEDDCSAKNPQLFDPAQQGLTDPLGPLTSFRCYEFGVQCDINDRNKVGPRKNCVPAGDYLFDVKTRFVDFYKTLKPPGRVIVAAIAGPTDRVEVGKDGANPVLKQSCQSANGIAVPAIRVKTVIDAFAPDSQFTSICEADFGPAMTTLGQKILGKLGSQCIPSPLLTANGGVACQQGDRFGGGASGTCSANCLDKTSCTIVEIVNQGTPQEQQKEVKKCPAELWYPKDWQKDRACGQNCPCWRIVKKGSADCDPSGVGSPYALDIMRQGEAAKGTVAEARCLTSPHKWGSNELGAVEQCL